MALIDFKFRSGIDKQDTSVGAENRWVDSDNVRFRSPVVPPSILTLESKKIQDRRGIWKFDCKASLEENLVCSATILCADRPK